MAARTSPVVNQLTLFAAADVAAQERVVPHYMAAQMEPELGIHVHSLLNTRYQINEQSQAMHHLMRREESTVRLNEMSWQTLWNAPIKPLTTELPLLSGFRQSKIGQALGTDLATKVFVASQFVQPTAMKSLLRQGDHRFTRDQVVAAIGAAGTASNSAIAPEVAVILNHGMNWDTLHASVNQNLVTVQRDPNHFIHRSLATIKASKPRTTVAASSPTIERAAAATTVAAPTTAVSLEKELRDAVGMRGSTSRSHVKQLLAYTLLSSELRRDDLAHIQTFFGWTPRQVSRLQAFAAQKRQAPEDVNKLMALLSPVKMEAVRHQVRDLQPALGIIGAALLPSQQKDNLHYALRLHTAAHMPDHERTWRTLVGRPTERTLAALQEYRQGSPELSRETCLLLSECIV